MRMSQLFFQTLRDAPAEAEITSHQLLLRSGYISQLGAGIFSALPLARRSLAKIETKIKASLEAAGGQEVGLPVVQPAEIWKESGRFYQSKPSLGRFKDDSGRELVLAVSDEEAVADLARKQVHSYKQLPLLVYQIQPRWTDELRPRKGWLDLRQFTGLDVYSLDRNEAGLAAQYRALDALFANLFKELELPVVSVLSSAGWNKNQLVQEWVYLHAAGEEVLLQCACGYCANQKAATFQKKPAQMEALKPIEPVATPGAKTIDDLCTFLNIGREQTAKAVFLMATLAQGETVEERFVFAVVRGDMDVNEYKLASLLGASALRPASEEEIRAVGAVPGYASPVELDKAWVVVDVAVTTSPNLVAGANRDGFHLLNVNYGRDFNASLVGDLALAVDGAACPQCGQPLHSQTGVSIATLIKTGWVPEAGNGPTYLGEDGENHPVWMGSYHIGLERLLACLAEEHHDTFGLLWPLQTAPFQVHLVGLNGAEELAERLYGELAQAGLEVLYDDRLDSAGVKFNNADLIGVPFRLTVGKRALKENAVEFKKRGESESSLVPLEEVVGKMKGMVEGLAGKSARK